MNVPVFLNISNLVRFGKYNFLIMAERMIEFVKNKIIDFKVRIKSHFAMESSFGHLMETSTDLYLMSVRIDEICEGIKNAFRLRRSLF